MSGRRALCKDSNVTYEVTVNDGVYADSTIIKDNSKQGKFVEDDDSDPPVVFFCGSCKLPVGDSLSWAGSEDEKNQILLKRKWIADYIVDLVSVIALVVSAYHAILIVVSVLTLNNGIEVPRCSARLSQMAKRGSNCICHLRRIQQM